MTLPCSPRTWASASPRISPIAVFGAVRRSDGGLVDVVPDESRLRKVLALPPSGHELEALVEAAADVLTADCTGIERPFAYLAIGFGPASPDRDIDWWKGDFDEAKHPRWPKDSPESQGGRFRGIGSSNAKNLPIRRLAQAERVRILALRRAARLVAVTAAKVGAKAAISFVPVIGQIADAMAVYDTIEASVQLGKLLIEARAAQDYVEAGPHALNDLRASQEDLSSTSFRGLKAKVGTAVSGYQYHHIVEQSALDDEEITARAIHSSENVIRIPTLLHEAINAEYSRPSPTDPSLTLREWLHGQSYQTQREYGIKVMQQLGIIE